MGRPTPSISTPPQAYRKEQRAKRARQTINRTIPALLASDAQARRGIGEAELISTPSKNYGKSMTGESCPDSSVSSAKAREPPQISIRAVDTLVAARDLPREHKSVPSNKARAASQSNIAILNMASPLRPGGGVLNGATSQEETLCVRTTLLPSLKEQWYRLPELGGIWSPDVRVFRLPSAGGSTDEDVDLPKAEQFYVNVLSAAMMRFPDTNAVGSEDGTGEGTVYAHEKDRELLYSKIRAVMRILEAKSTRTVVLGAWGCGAYGNPVSEVAKAWKRVLLGETRSKDRGKDNPADLYTAGWKFVERVVFAIKDRKMAQEFASTWGLLVTSENNGEAAELVAEDDQDADELNTKILELEALLKATRSPILKERLEITLRDLKLQLVQE